MALSDSVRGEGGNKAETALAKRWLCAHAACNCEQFGSSLAFFVAAADIPADVVFFEHFYPFVRFYFTTMLVHTPNFVLSSLLPFSLLSSSSSSFIVIIVAVVVIISLRVERKTIFMSPLESWFPTQSLPISRCVFVSRCNVSEILLLLAHQLFDVFVCFFFFMLFPFFFHV